MFKSHIPCSQCKGSYFIQNKRKHLCSDCVFKNNHNGKDRGEVYSEKSKKYKSINYNHILDDFEKESIKKKSIKKISKKQSEIEREYKKTCIDIDYTREKICSGCLKYQGGDIKLSHSHLISRKDCHNIGKPELIYNPLNITYHCMDFGNNKGCHKKWENPKKRKELFDYNNNIEVIKKIAPEILNKYKTDK